MQERPNKLALLMAIGRFLMEEVRPALSDPRLAFRALIAANLASVVASELGSDDAHVTAELERLRGLFPDGPVAAALPDFDARRAALADANTRFAAWLRDGAATDDELARAAEALRQTLREKLSVDNPRFDTSLDIE
jgi:hypothetical protein